jgi:hypothetical protein
MFPAFLIRSGIDIVRHDEEYKDSNPYSRCEATVRLCQEAWEEHYGKANLYLLEPAVTAAYWSEFFHAEDPLPDESEWRDGLIKRSGQYDSFDEWQEWFKKTYAKVYKEDNIWLGVLMTSWAHTHQYEVSFSEDSWEFNPASSYLPTSQMWRLEPHMVTAAELIKETWHNEEKRYRDFGFAVEAGGAFNMGRVECLGFDTKKYTLAWPPRSGRDSEILELGQMVADVVAPVSDDWYRRLDNVIFAEDYIDITALVNRATYILGSHRRLLELSVDNEEEKAKMQAHAEGWLVPGVTAQ